MKPEINKVDLTKLSQYNLRKICSCKKPCTEGLTISTYNDGMMMCVNDARKFMFEINRTLDNHIQTNWTSEEEQYIIELVKRKGMYRGINRDIADATGKTYGQAKSKTRRMKEKGLI